MFSQQPPCTLMVMRFAVFVVIVALVAGDTSSRRHLGRQSRLERTSRLTMPCADPRECEQPKFAWEKVSAQAQSALLEAESGLIMVWGSLVSSAERRLQYLQLWSAPRPLGMITVHQDVRHHHPEPTGLGPPPASGPSDMPKQRLFSGLQAKVAYVCLFMAIGIYAAAFALILRTRTETRQFKETLRFDNSTLASIEAPEGLSAAASEVSLGSEAGLAPAMTEERSKTLKKHSIGHFHCDPEAWSHDCVDMSTEELIDSVGVSAMTLFSASASSGISKLPYRIAVPLISFQSILLQGGLLYFILLQLAPREHGEKPLPKIVVMIAIYLHFLNCISEVPYVLQIFRHIGDFHEDLSDLLIMSTVLITDAFVVPFLSFLLGALYICTSTSTGDVILNSVAVAFIREIDNWILGLDNRTNFLAGRVESRVVHIPTNKEANQFISWFMCYFPVLPACASITMCWLSFNIMNL